MIGFFDRFPIKMQTDPRKQSSENESHHTLGTLSFGHFCSGRLAGRYYKHICKYEKTGKPDNRPLGLFRHIFLYPPHLRRYRPQIHLYIIKHMTYYCIYYCIYKTALKLEYRKIIINAFFPLLGDTFRDPSNIPNLLLP